MLGHMYWMQGWDNAPPKALRNYKAWKDAGFDVIQWDDSNYHKLMAPGITIPDYLPPAVKYDIIHVAAQFKYGGFALGADSRPLRPDVIKESVSILPSGIGQLVWQEEHKRPYTDLSYFPAKNKMAEALFAKNNHTLKKGLKIKEIKRLSPVSITGPNMWAKIYAANAASVNIVSGTVVFLFEPRRKDTKSKDAWFDPGLTGDWWGKKKEVWK